MTGDLPATVAKTAVADPGRHPQERPEKIFRIVPVHGTFATAASIRGDQWWQKTSESSTDVLSHLDTKRYRIFWEPFVWSGRNSLSDRVAAGAELADEIQQRDTANIQEIVLCHSHGGNVFVHARRFLSQRRARPLSISIGTPYLVELSLSPNPRASLLQKTTSAALIVALVLLFALEAFVFSRETDILLLIALILCGVVLGLVFYLKGMVSLMSRLIGAQQQAAKGLSRLFLRRPKPDHVAEQLGWNSDHIKIFSMYDEAILALRKAHRQNITLANRDNAMMPATLLCAIVVMIVGLIALDAYNIRFWNNPDLAEYVVVSPNMLGQPVLERWLNTLFDLLFGLLFCLIVGYALAKAAVAAILANLFNATLNRILLKRAVGQDGSATSFSIPALISDNLPMMIGRDLTADERWLPMPKDFDDTLEAMLDAGTVESARSIRETLAMGRLAGEFNIFSSIATNFSGEELVHSSYFRHPDFAAFIAWILITKHGFPAADTFSVDDTKFERWFDAIAPLAAKPGQVTPGHDPST